MTDNSAVQSGGSRLSSRSHNTIVSGILGGRKVIVACTSTCTLYINMYTVHQHVHCTSTCTLYINMYTVHQHVHCTSTCTLYINMYTVHQHVHCTSTCTLYINMYTVHQHVHCSLYIILGCMYHFCSSYKLHEKDLLSSHVTTPFE